MIPVRIFRTLALAAGPLLLAGEARACSKSSFATQRAPNMAHLIGTATPDTLHGGQGAVRFRVAPGHAGPAGERTIYGQVVEAERIGGLAAARLPAGTRRVLLVPWDYGPDCAPTPWMGSALWVQPGVRGLFHAILRDSALWVNGVPTLDVMSPDLGPYPLRLGMAQHSTRFDRHYQLYVRREPEEVGARFFLLPDGSARVEQTMDLGDGRRLVIRGERISRVTIPDPY